ncbi:hypothetical protein HELRODRAFT_190065 [Helobdella robusta]|uniref:Uncharacterized protein n=1 Tax=Helobdella robusta TaxID=6412 RepID=T1FRN1_HELRO|nr:hypothetical protein HELRODRAFT_190065 [Helobdella robusta]ESO11861.1 hypothetical protein HELRODRAFT_190065 [Helobdella robusta]
MKKITNGHANEVGKPLDADGDTVLTNENIAGLFSGGMLNYFRIPDDLKHLDNLSITDETIDDISMTTLTDGDVEYSLREVFPSEDLCKKLRKQASSGALTNNASKANDINAKSSRKHSKLFFGADDSLNDFNISMAKSYIFQEEVRQELKTSMKKVKEEALALGGNVKSKSSSVLYHGHHPLRTHQQPNLQQPPNLQLQQPPLSSSRQEQPPTSTTQVFKKTFSSIKKGADDVYPSYVSQLT